MKADYEHYKSHWEFFKSVNPKASELFFIDLQLKKLNETLENGLVNIDFSNDNTQTLEGYLNEQERQNFFFQKEYSEYLETRKADLLKVNNNELLEYNKVFFVHYQCDDFNEGEKIAALCIHSNGRAKEYSGDEAENIKEYANKVNELLNEGLFLVHWNQDRPNYGTDHIQKRYYDLTGENLELEYSNGINLAEWLIFKYGQHYISHPRLDNLAKLNEFQGIREIEAGQRTFATNRLMLLTKIYFNALNETLKTEHTPIKEALPPQQSEKPKPELKLNEFFVKDVSIETIKTIQTEFKELEGKELAILIYLLHKEHQIIEILTNSNSKGRKGFVKCLKEIDNPTMQSVNKCFTANTDDLIYSKDDLVFQSLNKRLTKIIKI